MRCLIPNQSAEKVINILSEHYHLMKSVQAGQSVNSSGPIFSHQQHLCFSHFAAHMLLFSLCTNTQGETQMERIVLQ